MLKNTMALLSVLLLLACGASKTVKESKKTLKGEWVLNELNSTVIGELNFIVFGQSTRKCMLGSKWEFIPNNNTGFYTESNNSTCSSESNYFVFTVDSVNEESGLYDFLLKPTNRKGKSETNKGFRLKLESLTDNKMVWKHTVNFEGKPQTLTFNFNKQ